MSGTAPEGFPAPLTRGFQGGHAGMQADRRASTLVPGSCAQGDADGARAQGESPQLWGVSVGPGDPELMTIKALRVLESCPVIAVPVAREGAASLALGVISESIDLGKHSVLRLLMPMSRDERQVSEALDKAAETVAGELSAGRDVAFACLGDVSIYSTYARLSEAVRRRGYRTQSVAGVPSFCAAAARLGVPLTSDASCPVHIIPARGADLDRALEEPGCKVVMKAGRDLARVIETLRAHGLLGRTALVVNCGLEGERVVSDLNAPGALDELLANAKEENGGGRAGYFVTLVVRP